MKILVTGGLGYIGSHIVVELLNAKHDVTIMDNLCNSKISTLDGIEKITGIRPRFHLGDVKNLHDFPRYPYVSVQFDCVIHCAGLKSVADSVQYPIQYFENNITGTINVLKFCSIEKIKKLIFSSSATVYGNPAWSPVHEKLPKNPENPYALSKLISEQLIEQTTIAADWGFSATCLRYFNPIGAHESGLIFENPNGKPNNLMPLICEVASGKRTRIDIFGENYNTPDGTCIRDYIHVTDIAEGHLAALIDNLHFSVYNLGTGQGTSVKEIIQKFEEVNKVKIPSMISDARPGDVAISYADPSNAQINLNWKAEKTLDDMVRSSWDAISKHTNT